MSLKRQSSISSLHIEICNKRHIGEMDSERFITTKAEGPKSINGTKIYIFSYERRQKNWTTSSVLGLGRKEYMSFVEFQHVTLPYVMCVPPYPVCGR